jgi:hypothetical protein
MKTFPISLQNKYSTVERGWQWIYKSNLDILHWKRAKLISVNEHVIWILLQYFFLHHIVVKHFLTRTMVVNEET